MRYGVYGRTDSQGFTDGDGQWVGIDSTRNRDKVAPGMLYIGENTRLRTGTVKQRAGTQIPQDFNPVGGFASRIIGSGQFRDPNGAEMLLVAPAGVTYAIALAFGGDPLKIDYSATTNAPAGDNGTGIVEFVQTFDSVHMFRIPIQSGQNLVWNGNSPTSDANRWQHTVLSPDGRTLIPGMYAGEPWGDRSVFFKPLASNAPDRDTWLVSDLYDYSSYDPVYQKIRTNAAQSDIITSIKQYFRGSVVIYKHQSIHMGTDLGLYPFQVGQRKLADIGSIGLHMPLDVGGDQMFLSMPNGFYRLSEVIQEQIVALPMPVSEPIQRVIDSINWPYTALWGCSAALNNYAFFGVAIGPTAQRLNTILVYDTQRRQWESAGDTWRDPSFAFNRLHVVNFNGVNRLVAVDNDNGIIYLLYEGVRDELVSGSFSVPFKMETRGYIGGDGMAFKRFARCRVAIASWDPSVNVTAIMDGVNEEFPLTTVPLTKDNTAFYTHGKAPFDPATDDASAPFREDYSISDFDNVAVETFEELPEGPISYIPGELFQSVGATQEVTEAFMIRQNGRWGAIRVENDEGFVEVKEIVLEGIQGANTIRTAA